MADPKILIAPADFQNRWTEMSDEQYHADKTAVGSSSLRRLMKSPKSFHANFFDGNEKADTLALKIGRLTHLAILQGDKYKNKVVVQPKFTGYTQKGELTDSLNCKEVKDKLTEWKGSLDPDAEIVTEEQRDMILGMVQSLVQHEKAFLLLKDGKPELSGHYRDPLTGLRLKFKPDFVAFNLSSLVELKTTTDCSEESFMRTVFNNDYRYDIQLAQHTAGTEIVTGKKIEHRVWIALEKTKPYEVAVHEADDIVKDIGDWEYRNLLNKLEKCIAENKWPGYQSVIQTCTPPEWVVRKYAALGVV